MTSEKAPWRNRLVLEWITVLLLGLAVTVFAAQSRAGQEVSAWLFDRVAILFAPEPDARILIVQIDEASLAELGRWPWPRSVHARLIDRLTEGNVSQIGYDVLFVEPSTPEDDAELADALGRSKRVVLPTYVTTSEMNGGPLDVQLPLPNLRNASQKTGHVNVVFDADGQVRHADLSIEDGAQAHPHMMKVVAENAGVAVPDFRQKMIIPFNPAGSFSAVSAVSIVRGEVPQGLLKGRIVLVGATAQGNGDILSVPGPAGSVMPGVEVQANMLSAMLQGVWLRDAAPLTAILFASFALLLLMAAYWWLPPDRALLLSALAALLGSAVSVIVLAWLKIWLTPVPLLAGLMLAYPMWSWRRLSALDRFVQKQVVSLGDDLDAAKSDSRGRFGLDTIATASARLRDLIGELGERRRFVQDVIESAPDAMCVVNSEGRVVLANSRAKGIFGPEVEGRSVEGCLVEVAKGRHVEADELELIDGRTMLVREVSLGSSAAGQNTVLRMADISDRRANERERNEFLEFLSHDMRAPLARILGVLETARKNPAKDLPFDRIADHARTSLKLADDFVQLARLSAITPEQSLIDLRAIADEAVDRVYDVAKSKQVRVSVEGLDEPPLIAGDSSLLMRAIANLLDNAIRYSPKSGVVRCSIRLKERSESATCDYLECTVADQGPGISPERLAALFQRFGPNDPSKELSAGLGLAFVKRAVDLMGGSITLESATGGTIFVVAFPTVLSPESIDPA